MRDKILFQLKDEVRPSLLDFSRSGSIIASHPGGALQDHGYASECDASNCAGHKTYGRM